MKSLGLCVAVVVLGGCQNKDAPAKQANPANSANPANPANPAKAADAPRDKSSPPVTPAPTEPPVMPGATPIMPGSDGQRADAPYKSDVQKICDVVTLSGATNHDSNDRAFLVATWLGKNLETPDARKWLVSLQRLGGNAKADALEQEARRVGLAGCALATEWRNPPPP